MCTIWSICLSEADIYAIYAYLCVQPELACTLLSGVEVMEVFMNASYGIYASLNPINKSSGFSWTIQTFQTYHVGNIVGDLILWWYNIYLIYNIYNIYIYIIYVVILYNIYIYIYYIFYNLPKVSLASPTQVTTCISKGVSFIVWWIWWGFVTLASLADYVIYVIEWLRFWNWLFYCHHKHSMPWFKVISNFINLII